MKTDGFSLHWRLSDGRIIGEPVIGWIGNNPINPTGWLPISPAKQDTSTGEYYLRYNSASEGARAEVRYWTVVNGVIEYYVEDEETAIQESGV